MHIRITLDVLVLLFATGRPTHAQTTTFATPEQATRALVLAVRQGDADQLAHILGPTEALLHSDDEAADASDRREFIAKYDQMHRLVREADGSTVLYVGAENWPFPIPLDSTHSAWHFDTDRGAREVLYRRIGENELRAIDVCHALVAGTVDAGAIRTPFYGYAFRPLPGAAKAYVAYPVAYRSSGIMTFVVDHHNVAYEKDNGSASAALARAIVAVPHDGTWHPTE